MHYEILPAIRSYFLSEKSVPVLANFHSLPSLKTRFVSGQLFIPSDVPTRSKYD